MAIPNSPLTRSEEYLNNIATGEGAIPDVPLTRIEQYLDYIAKNGGSGGGGSGGSVFVVGFSSNGILNKTAREIMDAMLQKSVGLYVNKPSMTVFVPLTQFMYRDGSYEFMFGKDSGVFRCSSENDYPTAGGN